MTHFLRFAEENRDIFELIRDGKKTVETRAATPMHQSIKVGDLLEFACGGDKFTKTVSGARWYKTIKALLKKYTVEDIHPNLTTEKELVAMYESFPGYKEKIAEFGIVAFELSGMAQYLS